MMVVGCLLRPSMHRVFQDGSTCQKRTVAFSCLGSPCMTKYTLQLPHPPWVDLHSHPKNGWLLLIPHTEDSGRCSGCRFFPSLAALSVLLGPGFHSQTCSPENIFHWIEDKRIFSGLQEANDVNEAFDFSFELGRIWQVKEISKYPPVSNSNRCFY
jgi:hypothetical protein